MQDKHRQQRQAKRSEKNRKKRAKLSRPATDGPTTIGTSSAAKGRTWPAGECYVSEGWDEPGAVIDVVFSRSRADGGTVLAEFSIDRSGPGLLSARALGGLRQEHVAGECGALSERSGRAMVGCSAALAASLVDDAVQNGTSEPAGAGDALRLLEDVPRMELPVPFGPPEAPEPGPEERPEGWLGGIKRLFGAG